MMRKQFFRVKQLADQTFLRADKSEVLNQDELHIAEQRVEYLRTALSAIIKKLPQGGQNNDNEKRIKKSLEHHLAAVFQEQASHKIEIAGGQQLPDDRLFQSILRDCAEVEYNLSKEYADHESKVEDCVSLPIQRLLDTDFPSILKQKRMLSKYILDKDSVSNRYHSTKKEALRDDMEEADGKVEQTRDALAHEMFSLLAKENEISGYILQILKWQRAYHESALKHLEDVIPQLEKRIGESPVKRVYGTSLKEHLRVTGKRIAYPLEFCISFLTKYGLHEEGLLRIAAGASRVKRLKAAFDSGCLLGLIPEYQDVHVLANALKTYLRELPDPLLTSHLYKDWMQSMHRPEQERLGAVKSLIAKLPQENRENLSFLMQFLAKLSQHQENKMTSSNIAIVIAPNMLWDKDRDNMMKMEDCATINMIVEMFIKEVEFFFPEDLSHLVTLSVDEETTAVKTANLNNADMNVSTENISVTDSPKPNSRRKKVAAPVPPNITSKTDQDVVNHDKTYSSYPSGSSTLNRQSKAHHKQENNKKSSNVEEVRQSIVQTNKETHNNEKGAVDSTPLVNLDSTKTVEHKYVTQIAAPVQLSKAMPVQPAVAQNTNCDSNKSFKTTAVHSVPLQKPVAAPRSIDLEHKPNPTRSSSIRIDVMSKSMSELGGDFQMRRPETAHKPEVPARPASLQKRPPGDCHLDPAVQKTQCSVYSVAHKQQPSYVSVQNKTEKFQPGHDNQIAEKEKFLGHVPKPNSPEAADKENAAECLNLNLKTQEKSDTTKSNEDLTTDVNSAKFNGTSSHTRTRSDGTVVNVSDSSLLKTPPSPRSLSKPSQPPPPPPINNNKKESDSTDL